VNSIKITRHHTQHISKGEATHGNTTQDSECNNRNASIPCKEEVGKI